MQMTKILRGEQNIIVARFICLRLWNKFALKYDDCVDIKGVAWSTIALYKSPAVAIMQFRILAFTYMIVQVYSPALELLIGVWVVAV